MTKDGIEGKEEAGQPTRATGPEGRVRGGQSILITRADDKTLSCNVRDDFGAQLFQQQIL
jgi:hypothetical protein